MKNKLLSVPAIRLFLTLALAVGTVTVRSQTDTQNVKSNVVLVHGAFADGSSWAKLIPILQSKGYNVVAVQLPLTSFCGDVATVRREIARTSGPVILVGHSYGGAVITEAGSDPRVDSLVYVAAFAPDKGESALSLSQAAPAPTSDELRPDSKGFLKLTDRGIKGDLAPDLSLEEVALLTAAQAPTSADALSALITNPAWKNKPSWYIIAANDRAIAPTSERSMAVRIGASTSTVPSSHVVMLSHPKEVAAVIDAAGQLQKH
ncbi:alpha/beta hydrolase [Granulicella sibirica]|uniref:Putative signal peptide protein n=1 Tax=Granulicella sibirica TaxID=2479048 RepID=A0A4Q0SYB2_9BACT|nr:alpha/beta hydrolase [Granulicella sibirica]RXH55382.1 putative signal peptide protein [Granulicella sibirica]